MSNTLLLGEGLYEKQMKQHFTKRESEILQHVMAGFKNKEIAEKLNIAERTVEFHKQNIYLKLEVANTVDLYKAALRLNLLSARETSY